MRMTIDLDDDLYQEPRRVAVADRRTLTSLIEDAVRDSLARRSGRGARRRAEIPVFHGTGLLAGVDLETRED